MTPASIIALLQTAILLLTLVQSNPSVSPSLRAQATQVAEQAISQATAYSRSSQSTSASVPAPAVVPATAAPAAPSCSLSAIASDGHSVKDVTNGTLNLPQSSSVTISWVSPNAAYATDLSGDKDAASGSATYAPRTSQNYTWKFYNSAGQSASCSLAVNVYQTATASAPTCTITPSSSGVETANVPTGTYAIRAGAPLTLTWNSQNAQSATLNGEKAALNGSETFSNLSTPNNTFTLGLTGLNGTSGGCSTSVYVDLKG